MRKGKTMATSWSENESEEDPPSDKKLTINYTTFGATHVEVEIDDKDALTSDPIDGIDEKIAKEIVGVATHWDMAHITSSDQSDGLDEKDDSVDYVERFKSSKIKNEKEIQRLKVENLELSTQVNHLNGEVVRSMVDEDKLKNELALSMRREEGLKRELEEARAAMAKMALSTEKLDHMLGVVKRPSDKRGLGYINDKDASSSSKTTFVKGINIKMSPPPQHPRKKIDL
ncbi:hypothetical protein Q3G72_028566 [Acer saccharum]|nr:hypothetical protein Q3G72_028566 [Acer saccharum]